MTTHHLSRSPLAAIVWVAAYLYGSLPFVHLLARTRAVDLKDIGSGNVGASNLWLVGGARLAVVGWLLDASKGWLPVRAADRLGLGPTVAALAGACGLAGQCWPVWLQFSGGRGVSAFVGASFAVEPVCWLAGVAPLIAGSAWRMVHPGGRPGLPQTLRSQRSRSVPLGAFLAAVTFPLAIGLRRRAPLLPSVLLGAIILLRRLTAPLPDDVILGPVEERRALAYRLLYDRNTAA